MNSKLYSLVFCALLALSLLSPAKASKHYQSEWVSVPAGQSMQFFHNFNSVPSDVNILVATYLEIERVTDMAVPYQELTDGCIRILFLDTNQIMVSNTCNQPSNLLRVSAVVYR